MTLGPEPPLPVRLAKGPLAFLARPAYHALITAELAWMGRSGQTAPTAGSPPLENITALIKTFERPAVLRRLVASLRRVYPDLRVLVVDDSREPVVLDGVEVLPLPFDTGLARGRNEGLRRIETEYTLLLDDDFVFYPRTTLIPALRFMERHRDVDILGGEVVDLPWFRVKDYRANRLYLTAAQPLLPAGSKVGGLPVMEMVANFFLARTDRLRLVDWDPDLKMLEHTDFFTRARGLLTTVFDKSFKILHAPTPFDAHYQGFRKNLLLDKAVLQHKYDLPGG